MTDVCSPRLTFSLRVLLTIDFLIRLPSLISKNVRGLLDEDQRQQFADIVTCFKENLTPLARDLAFLLGFYVKVLTDAKTILFAIGQVVVGRWWGQFRTLPWPDSMALQLNGLVLPDQVVDGSKCLSLIHLMSLK